MIKIHFTSGLGNQLFQFFFGEAIKLNFPHQKVKYVNSLQKPYQINLNNIFILEKDIIDLNSNPKNIFYILIKYLRVRYFKVIIKLNINIFLKIYSDNCLNNKLSFLSKKIIGNINFYGYWQNYYYFQGYFEKIRSQLVFKKKNLFKKSSII